MKGNAKINIIISVLFISCLVFVPFALGGSLVNSKHDLSNNSTYGFGVATTTEPCVFCHTPHAANSIAPLWNRNTPASTFVMYSSDTMDTAHPGQPRNNSLVCLSCHDGVLGDVGDVINAPGSGLGNGVGCKGCHEIWGIEIGDGVFAHILGTELTNDHPISINYPTPAEDDQFNAPIEISGKWYVQSGSNTLPLFGSNKYIECSSCHNVHDPDISPFLRASNTGSNLCNMCHTK